MRAMGMAGGVTERRAIQSLGACRSMSSSSMGAGNTGGVGRAGGYNDDKQAKLANDIYSTDTGNKRLTDDTATPIGSLANDKSGGYDPKLNQREGDILMGDEVLKQATDKMARENPMSQGRESAMEKDLKDMPSGGGVKNPNKQNPRDANVAGGGVQ